MRVLLLTFGDRTKFIGEWGSALGPLFPYAPIGAQLRHLDGAAQQREEEETSMESSPPTIRLAFDQATAFFITATESVRPEQWNNPGLGEWSVRDLVGHTSRALLTVETYLGRPAPTVELTTPADYFRAVAASLTDPSQLAQRVRDAGGALGQDPIKAVG